MQHNRHYYDARDPEILKLRKSGLTLREIGKMYGISGERVRQICNRPKKSNWYLKFKQARRKRLDKT